MKSGKNTKMNMKEFQAVLAQEVEQEKVQDKIVTSCYIIQRKLKHTIFDIKEMPAASFSVILEEIKKEAKEQEKAYKKPNKTFKG